MQTTNPSDTTATHSDETDTNERRVLRCPRCKRMESIRLDWGICADCAFETVEDDR